jgi:hypothetical protein
MSQSQDKKEEREKLNRKKELADLHYHSAREEFDKLDAVVKKFKELEERKDALNVRNIICHSSCTLL